LSFKGAAPLAATSPAGTPQVKLVSILPSVIGPSQSTTVTWNADKKGSYSVRVGGSSCTSGTQVASGTYSMAPANATTKIGVSALPAEGANTVRVCVTAASKTGSATGTATRDTTPPTLSGTLTSSDSTQTRAYPGESVTVKVTASEPLSKLTVTCASSSVSMSPTDSQHWVGVLGVTSATPLGSLQCPSVGTDAVGNSNSPIALTGVSVLPPAPTVAITSHPDPSTTATDAGFVWTTSGTVTTTSCTLDGGTPASCTSPQSYSNLSPGAHTFIVTVTNSGGSGTDTYTWTVLPPPPSVAITSHPDPSTTATDAGFVWTTSGTVTTTSCTLDGGTPASCTSPQTYSNLSLGAHTFTVTATNSSGSGSDTYSWTILPPAPTVAITAHPDPSTTATDATLTWTTSGDVTTTTCTLDGATDTSCASPQSYSNLTPGSHTFTVTATNSSGSGSDTYTWTVLPPPGGCAAPAPAGQTLVFCDDFDGPAGSAPDSGKWRVYGGATPSRWGSECFVNDAQHISLDGNGNLVETATYNPAGVPCTNGSGPYESGGMDTGKFPTPLFSFEYGEVEARIKVPCQSGYGMWPAWWMTGSSWPQSGEADILEILANSSHGYEAKQSIHGPTSAGGVWSLSHGDISSTLWCSDYHVYGATWSAGQMEFTVDGAVQAIFTPAQMQTGWVWPFDSYAEKLFLDLQVGGSGGTVDNSTFPQSMTVDWVRVYG
jgi:PKD repeat protein